MSVSSEKEEDPKIPYDYTREYLHEYFRDIQPRSQFTLTQLAEPSAHKSPHLRRFLQKPETPNISFFSSKRSLSSDSHPPLPPAKFQKPDPTPFYSYDLEPLARLAGNRAWESRLQSVQRGHYFIALDLDECSVVGNDTNDILRTALYAKEHHEARTEGDAKTVYTERATELVQELCPLIVNPAMVRAVADIEAKIGYKPYIFAYTNKGSIEKKIHEYMHVMKACMDAIMRRPSTTEEVKQGLQGEFDERWGKFMGDEPGNGQWVYLEGSDASQGITYLWDVMRKQTMPAILHACDVLRVAAHKQLEGRIYNELQKLGAATWGMSRALGLDYNIPVVVSNLQYKDLDTIVPVLGLRNKDKLFLYDDKAEEHFANMMRAKPELADFGNCEKPEDVHMIPVSRFQSTCVPAQYRTRIRQILTDLDIEKRAITHNVGLRRDISQITSSWPEYSCLYDWASGNYRMGGHFGIPGTAGSCPPLVPWDTSLFTVPARPISQRALTASLPRFWV